MKLHTRTAREKLVVRSEPYWLPIRQGAFLGYYRGSRGGRWVARYRAPGASGGYLKTVLGEADDSRAPDGSNVLTFDQAQELAKDWFATKGGGGRRTDKPYTVGDALDDYMANFDGKSVKATRSRVDIIIRPALGDRPIAEITSAEIINWHKERVTAPHARRKDEIVERDDDAVRRRKSTANRDLTVLKAALNRAFREGKVASDNEWRKVLPFKNVDQAKMRYLTDDEARRLVNAMDTDFRPMVQAALLTGARYGSLVKLQVRDFDAQSLTLVLRDTKSGHDNRVYLEGEGVALFKRAAAGKRPTDNLFTHPSGRAWAASEQGRKLTAACIAAGIERCTFHDLRRTFGARLARKKVPMAVIAAALGHVDTRITEKHYAHLRGSYEADTIREHAAGMGIVEPDNVVTL